jgi:hypothetical protein
MVNDNSNVVSNALLQALQLKYQSEIQSARATMMVYLTKAVGIGEHPQHLEEMDKLMEIMENSCGKLECLQQYFGMNSVDNQLLASGVGLGDGDSDNNSSSHSKHHYTSGNENV